MRERPWPLIIIALAHLLAPLPNILLAAGLQDMMPLEYLNVFIENQDWFDLAKVFLIFPIAGISIYLMKPWSYFVFLAMYVLALINNIDNALAYPQYYDMTVLVGVHILDLALVSYFLIFPQVREVYFNSRVRWWESPPRFPVSIRGTFQCGTTSAKCRILDISEGGMFLRTSNRLGVNHDIEVKFRYFNLSVAVKGKIAYCRTSNGLGYGIKFIKPSPEVKNLIMALRLLNVTPSRSHEDIKESFKNWVKETVTTGKGLLPDIAVEPPVPATATNTNAEPLHKETPQLVSPSNVVALPNRKTKKDAA